MSQPDESVSPTATREERLGADLRDTQLLRELAAWHDNRQPTDRELSFIDLLARQAADLIELRQTHDALRASEEQYRQSEEHLRYLNEQLEERVRERTRELAEANTALQSEVVERRAAEERVKNLLRKW